MLLRHICLLLVALATRTHAAGGVGDTTTKLENVGYGADVLFVLDGSQRVTPEQWVYLQNWLNQMVQYWHIGSTGIQVGFYTYGSGSHPQYMLSQGSSLNQVQHEIQGLTAGGGLATAGVAIRQAYREGFTTQNGGRQGAAKIIVHVSSGPDSDPTFYQQAVKDAKQSGVAVYDVAVGAGATSLPADLSLVASEPTSRYLLTSQTYETLGSLTSPLATKIANELPLSASLPPADHSCLTQADVVFLLDGSSSVGDANFQQLLGYVKTFSSQLPVSQTGVHVGVMQFASRPSVEFGLNVYTDRESLLRGIDNIQYLGGGTNTADALNNLRTQMFSQTMGARPGVPRVAVVITDGRSASMAETVKAADQARRDHINLIAVGVGPEVNAAELQGIADQQQDVFQVSSYQDLPTITQHILQRACRTHVTVAPIAGTLDPHVVDPCSDKLPNCNLYDSNICTSYAAWARDNCAKTCNFCQPMVSAILPACRDRQPNCGDYALEICTNSSYTAWAGENCALYCGLCNSKSTASTGYYGQCFYRSKSYSTGETWFDGCDYECTCEDGATGRYKCYNRCPIYTQMPAECTLVQTPGECCLKPVCNFNPSVQSLVTSGLGHTADGMSVCVYQGNTYVQGESWDVGCQLKCICEDANSGRIRCQDFCPTYSVLPNQCHLEQKPGQCCPEPACEFSTQSGSMTGMGQISGHGAVTQPTSPPPCVDKLDNCAQYTDSACSLQYREWAADNCRKFCGLCSDGRIVASATDRCTYQGHQYRQGETWTVGCDQECLCEQAVYGYYRCYSLCPVYNNVPADCTRTPATGGACCETINCPSTTHLVPSTTNVLSIGSGNYIMQPNPLNPSQLIQIVPSLPPTGVTFPPNTPVQGYQAPTINGCLYKGNLYVQGQRWDDGCALVCECTSASQGMYSCNSRCPTYQNLPLGCNLVQDPADACCQVAHCQAGVNYVPIPVFQTGTIAAGIAKPPNPNELMATSSTILITQHFPQSANSPPTMPSGPLPTGGIGYCEYKGRQYRQSETWADGCDYNCLCQDASKGYWVCSDMCLTYPPMPQYCRLVVDPQFPCCHKPYCEIPGVMNSTFGLGSTHPPIITTNPPFVITTTTPPRPATCVYKGQEYSQGQEWYDGCSFKCTCYDATSNLYSCTARCPTYFGLDQTRCTSQPDPRDPTCCTVPVCQPPSTPAHGTTPIPTVPGGSFENTNAPGIVGYCDYKGTHYLQGDRWDDGCQYTCECLDVTSGRYRCDEKCPRFPNLPSACHLVTDFANPCCQKPTCDFTGSSNTISGQANVQTPPPITTPAPGGRTPVCTYNGMDYNQGQTWDDGCDRRCRCEDAGKGLYVCDDRCAKYASLPPQCVLVADPTDQCCRVPQCTFTPTSGQQTGQGTPPTFPPLVPGQITGEVNTPTPLPGHTPGPVGYCVYKGVQYAQGQTWEDGCDYTCVCEDSNRGYYTCNEKCPKYPNLPSPCRLVKDPSNPCCSKPDCTFTPTSGTISGSGTTQAPHFGTTLAPLPGHTQTPQPGHPTVAPQPGQTTQAPPLFTTVPPVTPSPSPVCVYRGQVYAEGQQWYDGCSYICICEPGTGGTYRCNDRCPSYPKPDGVTCTMKPDPKDPMCCLVPVCDTPEPTPLSPNGPYIVPTVRPQGVVTGGSVTPSPTPYIQPTPGPDGSTVAPPTRPPVPRAVCIYKGQEYTQGQKWQDGCDYNCECYDAPNGHYRCTEMCPDYPATPAGCYMVRDVYNPCCQTPVCPFPITTTAAPHIGTTVQPPTGPHGETLMPPLATTPPPARFCMYNGVPYRTGQTWDDGCDLKCRCENENMNVYRCDQRCARYAPMPGCVMVTDPRDACCLAPFCTPVQPTPGTTLVPGQVTTLAPYPLPTAVPGIIVGNSVNSPNQTYCAYDGKLYRQSETWIDGCDKTCVCVDQTTGRYECKERCPQYLNVPPYCTMVADPRDQCCEVPSCTPPPTQAPRPFTTVAPNPNQTPAPTPPHGVTQAPTPGPTPPPGQTFTPSPHVNPTGSTPTPQPRSVCMYKGAMYVQGQQWYDGCDKVCVCEDGMAGYYRCTDRCKVYDSVPAGCTMVVDPQDPMCCKVPQCAPTPGPLGYPTPPPGQSPTPFTVTNPPGIVTGTAPTPTPGPNGSTPPPINACVYKGRSYVTGQRWQDGCDYNCVCEDMTTGSYSCSERCSSYPMVPPQCHLSPDPNDYCCRVMTCDLTQSTPNPFVITTPPRVTTKAPILGPTTPPPTPNPNEPLTPRPIPLATITPPPGQTPPPTTTAPPVPQPFCVYTGVAYRQGQTWQEGCSKTCRCDNADMNYYTCFDRCPRYDNLDPRCTMTLDPRDQCCQVPVCPSLPTLAPTPVPGQTYPPGYTLEPPHTPRPDQTPTPGQTYPPHFTFVPPVTPSPGQTYMPPTTPVPPYQTFPPGYTIEPPLTPAPHQTPAPGQTYPPHFTFLPPVTPSPGQTYVPPFSPVPYQTFSPGYTIAPPLTPAPHETPAPGQTYPPHFTFQPPVTPSPGQTYAPPTTPFPVPHLVPTGSIVGNNPSPSPNTYCVYKGSTYRQGQKWDDGCDYNCTCIDEMSGRYVCSQKCDQYTNMPSYCVLTVDPAKPCCMKPVCTPPTTLAPNPHTVSPPLPGQTTHAPQPGTTQAPPVYQPPTPLPRSVCEMNGRSYTQGQQWYDGCNQICVCEDGMTGHYRCRQRCSTYPSSNDPTCVQVPDPSDPTCCTIPSCPNPQNPEIPTGHKGTITGVGQPTPQPTPPPQPYQTPRPGETPAPGHTFPPIPVTTQAPKPREVCVYKGTEYTTGMRWRDGCDYNCVCIDGMSGQYTCTDRCNKYPPLTASNCHMVPDPNDLCCQVPDCSPTPAPTLIPGETPLPGQTFAPTPRPNEVPTTALCVYQGVPYRTGQTWKVGCDKVCRCEDGMTGTINCDDRCPKYTNTQAGCRMVTDPQDTCCQIPLCENPNTQNPTQVLTGVPGTITGSSLPPTNPLNPLQPRQSVCVYRGVSYQQGQRWDDGCSYQCICDNAMDGHYSCTERCPRVPSVPAECQQVPDPMDMCCTRISCPVPGTQAPQPGTTVAPHPYTGVPTQAPPHGTTLAPNPFTTQAPVPRLGMCMYKNQYYREKQVWYDGCDAVCTCEDGNTGFYRCQPRCGTYNNVSPNCIMVPDPQDPTCCVIPECPLLPPGGTTPSGPIIIRPTDVTAVFTNFPTPTPGVPITVAPPTAPDGHTLFPPLATTHAPTPRIGCLYNGRLYHENERWDDGCEFACICLSDMTGQYQCSDKCPRMPSIPTNCVLIQDPQNACCKVPFCDFAPTPFANGIPTPVTNPTLIPGLVSTTPMYIVPGFVTSSGNNPTTQSPYAIPTISGVSQVCVYNGVMYRQGQTWDDGCSKTCICDVNGLYNCRDKCQSFPNLDPACVLRPNPQDPCCLVPDCNPNYVTPAILPGVTGVNPTVPGSGGSITGTRAPILVPTAAPGIITGSRPPITGMTPSLQGYSSSCIYKGAAYQQGAKWDDGCQYRCECVDALKGVYRCVERCSSMYFMPQGCTTVPDPNDSCCQRSYCSPDNFPTPTPIGVVTPPQPMSTVAPPLFTTKPTTQGPHIITVTMAPGPVYQGTRSPIGSTIASFTGKPPNMCVYTDGRTFRQGDTWTDGCAYNCICNDAVKNDYTCTFRCQVYSALPTFCQMVDDPLDHCCQKVSCTPIMGVPMQPISGSNTPTTSPTMSPSITNVVPIGTHTVISGSGLAPGENTPGFFGGRQVCVYKGTVYQPGQTWDDGCDYTCKCMDLDPAVYSCTTKCPKYPPLPQYCYLVDVPGQCCQSLKCNIPNAGAYNPIPQLTPGIIPTQAPPNQPQLNPQIILAPGTNQNVGGTNPPGGGSVVPPQSIGGVTERCIYQMPDGTFKAYTQGERWRVNNCDYDCECVDALSGYYECKPVCPDYTQGNLPPQCHLQNVQGQCCPAMTCTNPDGTVVNPILNPGQTNVPVYGVMVPGYSGFRPGYVPGNTNTINGQNNVCVYKGTPHQQGERWDDGCDYTCTCTDAHTGLYTCRQKCREYTTLPPVCHQTVTPASCCPVVQCDAPSTTAPPVTQQVTTAPHGPCTTPDKLSNCNLYDKATACVGVYETWARDNCAVTCGYCVNSQPTAPGPCVDKLTNCADYGTSACTGMYEPWARDNCAKTCNLCPCYDKLPNCAQYDAYACGGRYQAWAQDNCASTCGLCPGATPHFTTSLPAAVTGSGIVPDGWTLLLKGVAGAPGDLWNLWNSPNTANTNVAAAQKLTSEYMGHYKPALANSLDMCDFEQIKVSVYNHGAEMAYVIFDGRQTGRDNWFDPSRIISSSYTDIRSVQKILQMAGDPATGHEFYIGQPVSGCTGTGWIFVSTRNTCTYEAGTNPGFYYSTSSSAATYSSGSVAAGDVFAIMGLGGSCALGITTPHSHTATSQPACVYNGHIYRQGEWWTDGCQYNCTCEHADTGFYRCYDLCLTYPNLPQHCSLVKAPGECCAKPVGAGCDANTPACLYKDHIYQEGQTWDDGCDYTCTCIDGSVGRYECTSMCLAFNLPSACHMDPAPAGKCCPVPVCPSTIVIQYPAGYVPK